MMERSGAVSYVNAKASGILQKSFVGERSVKLFSVHSLPELWSLLFTEELPAVPELLLAKEIEKVALQKFIGQYKKLLEAYSKPDDIYLALLRYYDYENLKDVTACISKGETNPPALADLTPYNILNYNAYPNLQKMTEGSELSWYNAVPKIKDIQVLDNKLDIQYMKSVWNAISKLPSSEEKPIKELILEDFVLKNILWALRLKVYYGMEASEIKERLFYEKDVKSDRDIFAFPALEVLDKDIEKYEDWSKWKYANFLNPHEEGNIWSLDPCYVERCAHKYLQQKTYEQFHRYPLSAMVLVSWFKIKQNEYDTICAAAESIRLGSDVAQVMEMAGIGPTK